MPHESSGKAPGGHPATAVWFPCAGRAELRSEILPALGEADVRVRTLASGLSHGTEMLVYRGQVPVELELDLPTLRGGFEFPIKYGYASVGHIIEVGNMVDGLQVGDVIFAHHPHQTEFVVPASMAVRLPEDLDPEEGIFFANLEAALNVILDAHPRLGERVLVFGQGVVGLLVTRLCSLTGATPVIAVESIERRRALSRSRGADVVLEPSDDLAEVVRALTRGAGADIAIEATGNPTVMPVALDCLASEGTLVVCSWYGTKAVSLPLGGAFHRRRLRVISSQVGSIDPCLRARWSRERRSSLTRDLLPRLRLSELLTHRFPFRRAPEAYELVDRHPEETVQVILTYGETDV